MISSKNQSRKSFLAVSIVLLVTLQTNLVGKSAEAAAVEKTQPHLLFVRADSESPHAGELAKCEELTIKGYRDRGTKVSEISSADIRNWLEKEGKPFEKAQKDFQWIALAKSKGSHAVGGLDVFEMSADMAAASPMQPASHFFARGYALHACRHTNGIDLSGMNARPIPFKFSESGDPWALPVSIEPKPCGSAQRPGLPPVGSGKGKPFIGVALSGNVVQQVTSQSPAAGAGLQAGDQIVSFQGEPVSDPAQLGIILARLAPGDSVELEVKRGSETMKKKLTLADRYEAVESKQDRIGKPVADLVATDVHGREVRLSSFRGKVILLDFWATWCKPCREAMPALQLLSETLESRDFVWIGVSVDDDQDAWTSYVRDNRLGGIQLRSPEWANTMFVNSYPTILLVDRAGVIQCDSAGESVAQTVMAMLSEK